MNLNWSSLTPEVGEVTQCGGSSCAVTARKITEKELYLNDNGHSDIVIYKRK